MTPKNDTREPNNMTTHILSDLEAKAAAGKAFSREEAARVMSCADLVSVGVLAESARQAKHGTTVTFGQVLIVDGTVAPEALGDAWEVRITTSPASVDAACALVRDVVAVAGVVPVTGFSAAELVALAGADHLVLADVAARLKAAGLTGVAFLPMDQLEDPTEVVRALTHGGLQVATATIDRAVTPDALLDCLDRIATVQRDTSALRAVAPLPRFDDSDVPSSGYDDVRTIAVTRLVCADVSSIQVDWVHYGPKLAQVAIAYGADDIDNVPALDPLGLGHRRSPAEDIARQITAAFATPVARDGRFEHLR